MKATIVFRSPSFDPLVIEGEDIKVTLDEDDILDISIKDKEKILIFDPSNILYVHQKFD